MLWCNNCPKWKNRSWRVLVIDTHMTIIDLLPYTIHDPTISTLRKGRLQESVQRNQNLLLPCHEDFDPSNWVDVLSIVAAADWLTEVSLFQQQAVVLHDVWTILPRLSFPSFPVCAFVNPGGFHVPIVSSFHFCDSWFSLHTNRRRRNHSSWKQTSYPWENKLIAEKKNALIMQWK